MPTREKIRLPEKIREDREALVRRLVFSMALEPRPGTPLARKHGPGLNQRVSDRRR